MNMRNGKTATLASRMQILNIQGVDCALNRGSIFREKDIGKPNKDIQAVQDQNNPQALSKVEDHHL